LELPHRAKEVVIQDALWMLFCMFIMCESISLVSTLRLVPLVGGFGLLLMLAQLTERDVKRLVLFALLNAGILLSVAVSARFDIALFALVRAYIICPYVYLYLIHRGLDRHTLVPLALGIFPQLFVYVTGNPLTVNNNVYTRGGQFCGTINDPNYLCTYLVIALGAQFALIIGQRSMTRAVFWVATAIITLFIILMTLSRVGALATFLSLMIFGLSFKVQRPNLRLAIIILLMVVFSTTGQLFKTLYPKNPIGILANRFTEEGASSIRENERYDVWKSALNQIVSKGPIDYTDEARFISNEGISVHNVLLRLGLSYGWLTALTHTIVWIVGLASLLMSFCRDMYSRKQQKIRTILSSVSKLLIIFPYFVVIMSIPASDQYLYWYILGVIFTLGVFTPSRSSGILMTRVAKYDVSKGILG